MRAPPFLLVLGEVVSRLYSACCQPRAPANSDRRQVLSRVYVLFVPALAVGLGFVRSRNAMLIPTTSKQRLPQGFSYPVGAELLSEHLAGLPQFADLRVCFSGSPTWQASKFQQTLADGSPYEIVTAAAEPSESIYVYPVRSPLRPAARRALVSRGLPALRAWLAEHFPVDPLRPAFCRVMFDPPAATVFLRERVASHERDLAA